MEYDNDSFFIFSVFAVIYVILVMIADEAEARDLYYDNDKVNLL